MLMPGSIGVLALGEVEVDKGFDEVEDAFEVGADEYDGCAYEKKSKDCCHDGVLSETHKCCEGK